MAHFLTYAIVSLFFSVSSAVFDLIPEHNFVTCVANQSPQYSATISKLVYSPHSPSFSFIFQSSVQNFRFNSTKYHKLHYIITPYSADHVKAAIICSKVHGLQVRIRSGGHDYEGLSYNSYVPFIIIDLVNLNNVRVDSNNGTAWVQAGATVGELYYHVANQSKGRGFPAGVCPSMGAGGHISGGGQGTLMRKFGLAADNVVDAIVVTADGNILDRKGMGEDFFWAIRGGGGGNFGVVVEWNINLVPVPPKVTVFNIPRTLEQNATKLIHRWQQIAHKFHEDLFIRIIIFVGKDSKGGKTIQANFNSLFLGTSDQLVPLMAKSFPELGLKPEDCKEISWIQSTIYSNGENPGQPLEVLLDRNRVQKGFFKGKSDFVTQPISETNLEAIWEVMLEGEAGVMVWDPYGGKMSEISESSIPFPHRAGVLHNIQYFSKWQEGGYLAEQRHLKWINRLYNFMAPFVTKNPRTAYVNYRDLDIGRNIHGIFSEAKVWGEKYFKGNFDQLAHIKGMVDYGNFFKNEQSIAPNFYL
ncbi:PREDICTED: tetrahydrocannabinolic acid synthase-like [Prunus mume]|uniref:Tetrahydrocannabinolic acid synthase-like n=1 Tax=Prunus mume TaxID=102107 RepID=A0ABM0NJL6_PRUMU|nr:PREDICTED: tetrahydrocannabinolic acid synthase-like [Prunus mume]